MLDMMVESQEAMGGVVHSQSVLIAGDRLVVFGFRAIVEAHHFPFLAASISLAYASLSS